MHCLWCNQVVIPEMSWNNLLFLNKPKRLCDTCEHQLEMLTGNRCKRCSRLSKEAVCADCLWWEKFSNRHDPLVGNYSVFAYNQEIQDIVAKWKYRGDYCLGFIFERYFAQQFKKRFKFLSKDTIVVPIPLSDQRQSERRFNQAKMLADFLPLTSEEILTRTDGEKQSKKTRQERLKTKNPFSVTKKVNKPVVLVDDIYTTGTTLRHAATLLIKSGCPKVYAYTLIRG